MIWAFWAQAALPWSPVALVLLVIALAKRAGRVALRQAVADPYIAYFFVWASLTPAFFTISGNILWTYLLPALPAFAILMARALSFEHWPWSASTQRLGRLMGLACVAPVLIASVVVAATINPNLVKQKGLVAYFQEQADERMSFLSPPGAVLGSVLFGGVGTCHQ